MTAQVQLAAHQADPDGDWRHRAACTSVDPELFFPTAVGGSALVEQEAAAKAVCARCPVLGECRQWAVTQLPYGIAGGLTENERRAIRTRRPTGRAVVVPITASRREQPAQSAHPPADGSHGGNRAPVLTSHHNTQAGTAMEGHRA